MPGYAAEFWKTSQTTMLKEYTSDAARAGLPPSTSGAMYRTVPAVESPAELPSYIESPKSATLAVNFSSMSTFFGFKSR